MSLNTCCFPRIRFPLSHVLYLFSQGKFFSKFLDSLALYGYSSFVWRASFISCLYTIRFLDYFFFLVASALIVFIFLFRFFFLFLYTVLLPCSVGYWFGCTFFLVLWSKKCSLMSQLGKNSVPMVEEIIP